MPYKGKISGPEKIATIEKYLRGEDSLNHLATLLGVQKSSVMQWLQNYQSLGPNALLGSSKSSIYSKELKNKAVKDYLAGLGSQSEICKRYGLKTRTLLRQWILKYNSHGKLKSSGTGGTSVMTKGRTTTYDERVGIVKFCIEHPIFHSDRGIQYTSKAFKKKLDDAGMI
jgi:transposase